jgi:hypothetical protein
MVATQNGQEYIGRYARKAVGRIDPARLDVRAGVQVAYVLHAEFRERSTVLGHWRDHGGEVADVRRRDGGAFPVNRRAIVGNAGDNDVGVIARRVDS